MLRINGILIEPIGNSEAICPSCRVALNKLDDCIMIKWLEREGRKVHLKSRNPRYGTTTIDLSEEEDRLQIIGRAVYCFKSI